MAAFRPEWADAGLLATHVPPYELTSDMLFAAGLARGEPLQRSFQGVEFATLGGRVPILVWFARVVEIGAFARGLRMVLPPPWDAASPRG